MNTPPNNTNKPTGPGFYTPMDIAPGEYAPTPSASDGEQSGLVDFELGWNAGYSKAFETIRSRAKGFKSESHCLLIPVEALQDVDYADTERAITDHETLSKEFVRYSQIQSAGNKSQYIAVRADGTSHCVTLIDGEISTRTFLADRVKI